VLRENCLVAAIADMLLKVKSSDKLYLLLPHSSFSGHKIEIASLRVLTITATSFATAFEALYQHRSSFIGENNHGVAILMYSIIMTKGITAI
jgi:hypothetical protein